MDRQFADTEKAVLHTPPTTVRTPRDFAGLMAVLKRSYRGKNEVLSSELAAHRAARRQGQEAPARR